MSDFMCPQAITWVFPGMPAADRAQLDADQSGWGYCEWYTHADGRQERIPPAKWRKAWPPA